MKDQNMHFFNGSVGEFCEAVQPYAGEEYKEKFVAEAAKHGNKNIEVVATDLQRLKFIGDEDSLNRFLRRLILALVLQGYADTYDQGQFVGCDKFSLFRKAINVHNNRDDGTNLRLSKTLLLTFMDENNIPCGIELSCDKEKNTSYSILHVRNILAFERVARYANYYSNLGELEKLGGATRSNKMVSKELLEHVYQSKKISHALTFKGEKKPLSIDGKLNIDKSIDRLWDSKVILIPFEKSDTNGLIDELKKILSNENINQIKSKAQEAVAQFLDPAVNSKAIHIALANDVMKALTENFSASKDEWFYQLACIAMDPDNHIADKSVRSLEGVNDQLITFKSGKMDKPRFTEKQLNAPLVALTHQLTKSDSFKLEALLNSFKGKREQLSNEYNFIKHCGHRYVSSFLNREKEIFKIKAALYKKREKLIESKNKLIENKEASNENEVSLSENRLKSLNNKINSLTVSLLFIEKAHENLLTSVSSEFLKLEDNSKAELSKKVVNQALSTFCHVSARVLQNAVLKNEVTKEHDSMIVRKERLALPERTKGFYGFVQRVVDIFLDLAQKHLSSLPANVGFYRNATRKSTYAAIAELKDITPNVAPSLHSIKAS